MQQTYLPTPLARAAMRILPAAVLQRMIDTLMRGMQWNHPRLFRNLERLDAAIVRIEPSDLPHRFRLAFGPDEISLVVVGNEDTACDACIKGKLDALINLLEGRVDGDMLFFSRDIEITGNTAVVVALRNTLDREEINLLDDISALFGPFERPVRKVAVLMGNTAQRIKERIVEMSGHDSSNTHAAKAECDLLRTEVLALKTRLSKLEVQRQQKKNVA